jgi:hypothetical protein
LYSSGDSKDNDDKLLMAIQRFPGSPNKSRDGSIYHCGNSSSLDVESEILTRKAPSSSWKTLQRIREPSRRSSRCFLGVLNRTTIFSMVMVAFTFCLNWNGLLRGNVMLKMDDSSAWEPPVVEMIPKEPAVSRQMSSTTSRRADDTFATIFSKLQNRTRPFTVYDYNATRPPLHTLIDKNDRIIGDPGWLLDFAIMGYGKCGTSTMMFWLREHPEIQAFGNEKGHFMARKPGLMVRQLYENLEVGPYQRGYKAPQDVTQFHILDYYRLYWPHAKIIIGIRHPVRWFESLYNFRVQNLGSTKTMPHPNDLIGGCHSGRFLTCTNKGDFAVSLLKLGKHNYPTARPATDLERKIISRYGFLNRTFDSTTVEYMPNPLFLFELDQLGDSNDTRNEIFRDDFTRFMGLKEQLPALPHFIPGKKRTQEEQQRRDSMKIQICDGQYQPVRDELMVLARQTSVWIREVFLNSPTVYVSSRDHFESIMEGWMRDPCTGQENEGSDEEGSGDDAVADE